MILGQCPLGPFDYLLIFVSLPQLLSALLITIQYVGLSLVVGLILTVPLALMRVSKRRWIAGPVYAYTYLFRGTPLIIQLFVIYYGLGQFEWIKETFLWPYLREAFWCCLLAFTLNTTAYTTEILRGAISNVPHGEIEAAKACGMSKWLLYRRIILPRAFRLMLPAYSNEVILMLQATAIASTVGTATASLDLTGAARVIIAQSFAPYEIFLTIAAIYLGLTYLIDLGFRGVEHRLSCHLRDRPSGAAKADLIPGLR
jgi:putative lysine/arginine/ornithine/histidine/octopine transport system permease protein